MRPPHWFKRISVPLANKIVYASDAYVGLKSTINDMSSALIDFSQPPAGSADQRLLEFAHLIRPWTYEGLELIRVGGASDGGYVMANDFLVDGAVSIGVGPDVSWDCSIVERGVPLTMFDHTIHRPPIKVKDAKFYRLGVTGEEGISHCLPLKSLIAQCGYPRGSELILKMDIEGAEWSVLETVEAEVLSDFRQVVLELHHIDALKSDREARRMLHGLKRLVEYFLPIWVHANNFDPVIKFDNYWFPRTLEITLVRRNLAHSALPTRSISTALDAPCDSRVSEIFLEGLARLPSPEDITGKIS